MKLVIDAHLPRRAASWFRNAGCDAIHTLDLPNKNRTPDHEINDLADREQRIVITKDDDFVGSHLLTGRPAKLLLVSTGNITNRELEQLLVPLIPSLVVDFQTCSFIELGRSGVVIRG